MAGEPQSVVGYTNNDDGIWLSCIIDTTDGEPHWEKNMGFWPSVEGIVKEWLGHLHDVHPESQE